MQAEYLVVYEGRQRQIVKQVGKEFPDVCIAVFSETFIIKAIHLCDLARLVISAEDSDALWVSDLQSDQERHSFNGVVPTVNIVAYISLCQYMEL